MTDETDRKERNINDHSIEWKESELRLQNLLNVMEDVPFLLRLPAPSISESSATKLWGLLREISLLLQQAGFEDPEKQRL
jgi:hypothetical protein